MGMTEKEEGVRFDGRTIGTEVSSMKSRMARGQKQKMRH